MQNEIPWTTIPALLADCENRYSQRDAIVDVDAGKCLTFKELRSESRRAAAAFMAQGVARGDRVAIWAPNIWEWVVAALGLQLAGAALVPLNTRFKGREAAYILRRSRAKILVTITDFLGADYPAKLRNHELPDLQRIVLLRGAAVDGLIGESTITDACGSNSRLAIVSSASKAFVCTCQ